MQGTKTPKDAPLFLVQRMLHEVRSPLRHDHELRRSKQLPFIHPIHSVCFYA